MTLSLTHVVPYALGLMFVENFIVGEPELYNVGIKWVNNGSKYVLPLFHFVCHSSTRHDG